jgi:phosphoribosylanthranilate isomerase
MMKVKVCGMKYAENIIQAAELKPDFMGFIFYRNSKRFVGNDFAMPLVDNSIKKVGVFVNEKMDLILKTVEKHNLDFVQLHGTESAQFCNDLSKHVNIIKAFGIDASFDFSLLSTYTAYCNYFLFDTKSDQYGGTGLSFDRNLLKNYSVSVPYFISGGIDIEEIKNNNTHDDNCIGLDVNSKFESSPGIKDINKLKLMMNELQR